MNKYENCNVLLEYTNNNTKMRDVFESVGCQGNKGDILKIKNIFYQQIILQ